MTNYIFPGKFKPVHDGHVKMISDILDSPDSRVHVIISAKETDGISAECAKAFLDAVFAGCKGYDSIISSAKSPMIDAYDTACTKLFGDGTYSLVASAKDPDRSGKFASMFAEGSKYYTPGVIVIPMNVPSDALSYEDGTPVSSTSIRSAIAKNDEPSFMKGYSRMIGRGVKEDSVRSYYRQLRDMMNRKGAPADIPGSVMEGGAAGHMSHPYEYADMTFAEIRTFVRELLSGHVSDIKEKLDGMNIFASMNAEGYPVFARNTGEMKAGGVSVENIVARFSDTAVAESISNACDALGKVMREMPNGKEFFYYDCDGVRYQTWMNAEIISPETANILRYSDSFVSVHGTVVAATARTGFSVTEDMNEAIKLDAISVAAQRVSAISKGMSVQTTPSISVTAGSEGMISEFMEDIDEIESACGLTDESTMDDFRSVRCAAYMNNDDLMSVFPDAAKRIISKRILGSKERSDLPELRKLLDARQYEMFTEFEKTAIPGLLRDINAPVVKLFTNVGNAAIRAAKGLRNSNDGTVVTDVRRKVVSMIDSIVSLDDEKLADDMEYMLSRMDPDDINIAEGLVVKHGGRTFKLTGSFADISRMSNRLRSVGRRM